MGWAAVSKEGKNSVHDSLIQSCSVDFEKKQLTIKAYDSKNQCSYTFLAQDVLAHHFDHVRLHSVLLSIEAQPIRRFVRAQADWLLAERAYDWPISFDSLDGLEEYLLANQYQAIEITSSCGLCGWILAKKHTIWKESTSTVSFRMEEM